MPDWAHTPAEFEEWKRAVDDILHKPPPNAPADPSFDTLQIEIRVVPAVAIKSKKGSDHPDIRGRGIRFNFKESQPRLTLEQRLVIHGELTKTLDMIDADLAKNREGPKDPS